MAVRQLEALPPLEEEADRLSPLPSQREDPYLFIYLFIPPAVLDLHVFCIVLYCFVYYFSPPFLTKHFATALKVEPVMGDIENQHLVRCGEVW